MPNVVTVDAHVTSVQVEVEYFPPGAGFPGGFWVVNQRTADEAGGSFTVKYYFRTEPTEWIAFEKAQSARIEALVQ